MLKSFPTPKIISKLIKNGFDYADVFFENSHKLSIVVEDKKIESVNSLFDCGLALRGLRDFKTSFACSSKLEKNILADMSESFVSDTQKKGTQKSTSMVVTKSDNEKNKIVDTIALLQKLEKRAWGLDPKLVQVTLRWNEHNRYHELIGSESDLSSVLNHQMILSCTMTLSDGKNFFKGYDSIGGELSGALLTEENLENMILSAFKRAKINSEAPKIRGGTMAVVIDASAGGTLVHEAIGHGLESDLVYEGMSVYADCLEQKIASPLVSVIDDPTYVGKRGSFSFDDEGVKSERTLLIDKGILKNYLFDRNYALKAGVKPNGHGRRENFRFKPITRMSNTYMLPGNDNPQDIVNSVSNGLLVKMMGGGQVDTITGDFVFEVTEGYLIKNGQIDHPVRGATIAGNGPKILQSIDRVGNDIGYSVGTCGKDGQEVPVTDGMPTIRVPEMIVGGTVVF